MTHDHSKRIGTLTLHAGFNEGAVLQALALQRAVARLRPSREVEIIDHRDARLMQAAYGNPDNDRKRGLQAFYDTRLPLSPKQFLSTQCQPTFDYINDRYDCVLVGSDEVWKISFRKRFKGLIRTQTDPLAPAFPNVFWPDQGVSAKKISYAATVGAKTAWDRLPRRMVGQIGEILDGFAAIGVRDDRTRAFIEALAPRNLDKVSWTPDPTIIEDLSGEADRPALRAKLEQAGVRFDQPRVLLIAGANPVYDPAIENLRKAGFQIVSVSDRNPYADVDLSGAGFDVLEWAAMASQFDLCFSERMHGCIFALRNACPVICVDSRPRTMGMPTKNEELMRRMGLSERYVSTRDPKAADKLMDLTTAPLDQAFDREALRGRLDSYQQEGLAFLDRNLPAQANA